MTTTETHVPRPSPNAVRRGPGEPAPDLVDYRLVHRAMTVDFARMAGVAAELVERRDARREGLLRHYLDRVTGEVHSHHQVEDDHVWPAILAVAGDRAVLGALTQDHVRLDTALGQAAELAAAEVGSPQLVDALREVADLLARHVTDEEREIFPILEERLRVEDYEALQRRFRGNLRLRLLPFVVPWAVSHAGPEERVAVLASAPRALRILLAVFEPAFRARQRRLFGSGGLSAPDRRRITMMRRLGAAHTWVLRRSGGRVGGRWAGGADVLVLTVPGRRSGTAHDTPLLCLPDGDDLLVAASNGGVDREPEWWRNLRAHPRADVEHRDERFAVTAERVGADERPQLWSRFVGTWPGFAAYQAKVRREIAVVRLRRTRS